MTPEAAHWLTKNRRAHFRNQSLKIKHAWDLTAAMTSTVEGIWFLNRRHRDGADGTARTNKDCTQAKTLWARGHSKNKWATVSKGAPQKQPGGTDDIRKDVRRRLVVRTTPWASNQEKSATWRSKGITWTWDQVTGQYKSPKRGRNLPTQWGTTEESKQEYASLTDKQQNDCCS